MWLKSFKINDKILSEVELVVLSSLSDEYTTATELMDHLDQNLPYWKPERGTIYPILHRLTDLELLERSTGRNLQFRRTTQATTFLSSILSTNELLAQFNTTTRFLEILAGSMVEVDPFAAQEFFDEFLKTTRNLQSNIEKMQKYASQSINNEGWTEIDVE